ncbi:MAG TPA: low-complexity protein [Gammaproteobacteria bacterium]|nr:low-complexity protein [Gammaproteobacteria bacterium]
MSELKKAYPALPIVISAFAVAALAPTGSTNAAENPFVSVQLAGGYMMAAEDTTTGAEDKSSEGKCGGKSEKEAVCGMYKIGSAHEDESKVKDGKCGGHKVVEASCGGGR